MGHRPFPKSNGKEYILVAVDYVSKPLDAQVVSRFLQRNIFARFGVPRVVMEEVTFGLG